jgi:hypothetical protein
VIIKTQDEMCQSARAVNTALAASYVAALGFAIAAIYLGSQTTCGGWFNASVWLVTMGSLEVIQLAVMAICAGVAYRLRGEESTPLVDAARRCLVPRGSSAAVAVDCFYMPLRLLLICFNFFTTLRCSALRSAFRDWPWRARSCCARQS